MLQNSFHFVASIIIRNLATSLPRQNVWADGGGGGRKLVTNLPLNGRTHDCIVCASAKEKTTSREASGTSPLLDENADNREA